MPNTKRRLERWETSWGLQVYRRVYHSHCVSVSAINILQSQYYCSRWLCLAIIIRMGGGVDCCCDCDLWMLIFLLVVFIGFYSSVFPVYSWTFIGWMARYYQMLVCVKKRKSTIYVDIAFDFLGNKTKASKPSYFKSSSFWVLRPSLSWITNHLCVSWFCALEI